MIPEEQDNAREAHKEREFQVHVRMWIAVGVTTAAVLAVWAFLLPTQLRRISAGAEGDRARWTTLTTGPEAVGLQEGLQNLRHQPDALDAAVATPPAEGSSEKPQAKLPVLEERSGMEAQIDLLRARLESSSAKE